jgi:hypothetical protein
MFSKEYILQGYSLIQSLRKVGYKQDIWVLALDVETFRKLTVLNLDSVKVTFLFDNQALNSQFNIFRNSRNLSESIFSIKPHWIAFVLDLVAKDTVVFYIDSDSFFFRRLPYTRDSVDFSIFLSPHYFSPNNEATNRVGRYNAGFVGFRKTTIGMLAVNKWKKLCDEWCFAYASGERYADQKYLDNIAKSYAEQIMELPLGINVGNWSFDEGRHVTVNRESINIDGCELISFHFHSLQISLLMTHCDIERYGPLKDCFQIMKHIYHPYLSLLSQSRVELDISVFHNWPKLPLVIPRGMTRFYFIKKLFMRELVCLK